MNRKRAVIYGLAAFIVLLVDGLAKIAAHSLPPDTEGASWPIGLALHKNLGVIANFPLPLEIVIPLTVFVCGALAILFWKNRIKSPGLSLASWIILCGAAGNLIDRLINNYTTDYIILLQRSAINLSDVLILIGAVLFAWYSKDNSPSGATS